MSEHVRYATPAELGRVLRFEWRTRKAWRTLRAAVRGLWWSLLQRYPGELCEACGRPGGRLLGGTYWRADDALWMEVNRGYPGVLCAGCFTRDAEGRGVHVHWQPVVHARRDIPKAKECQG